MKHSRKEEILKSSNIIPEHIKTRKIFKIKKQVILEMIDIVLDYPKIHVTYEGDMYSFGQVVDLTHVIEFRDISFLEGLLNLLQEQKYCLSQNNI